MAMAFKTRVRPSTGRHSHRKPLWRLLLSVSDLPDHLRGALPRHWFIRRYL